MAYFLRMFSITETRRPFEYNRTRSFVGGLCVATSNFIHVRDLGALDRLRRMLGEPVRIATVLNFVDKNNKTNSIDS